jgi:hypothetical protein
MRGFQPRSSFILPVAIFAEDEIISPAKLKVSQTLDTDKEFTESHPGKKVDIVTRLVLGTKKAGRLESHLLWSFYDRSHEKTVYDTPGANPVFFFLLPH